MRPLSSLNLIIICCLFIKPIHASTLNDAQVLFEKGEINKARAILNSLILSHPNNPEAFNNLAALEAHMGNKIAAKSLLEKALATNPSYRLAYQNITKINEAIALDSYKKTLKLADIKNTLKLDTSNTALNITPIQRKTKIIEKVVEKPVYIEVEKIVEKKVEVPGKCPKPQAHIQTTPKTKPLQPTVSNLPDPIGLAANWANAWQNKDISTYINSYTHNFSNVNSGRHRDWVKHRTERIKAPTFIKVTLNNVEITRLSPQSASITFTQTYESNTLTDTVKKMLIAKVENGHWKIAQEHLLR